MMILIINMKLIFPTNCDQFNFEYIIIMLTYCTYVKKKTIISQCKADALSVLPRYTRITKYKFK